MLFETKLFNSTFLTLEDFYESVLSGDFRGEHLGYNFPQYFPVFKQPLGTSHGEVTAKFPIANEQKKPNTTNNCQTGQYSDAFDSNKYVYEVLVLGQLTVVIEWKWN